MLYALSVCLYLMAQQSVVSGSIFSISFTTRVVLCVHAILGVVVSAFLWKNKRRWEGFCKIVITVVLVGAIAATGFRDNRISCPAATRETTSSFLIKTMLRK